MENGIFEIFVNMRMVSPYPFGRHKNFNYSSTKNVKEAWWFLWTGTE